MASIFYFFGDKNVFILKNHTQTNGYSEGGVFVTGKALYNNYNVGTTLPVRTPSSNVPLTFSLYVTGEMDITGGTNTQNSALRPSGTLTNYTMTSVGGLTGQPLRTDEWSYSAVGISSWLECTSYGFAMLPTNGNVSISGSELTLTGASLTQNIFWIDAENILSSGTNINSITKINLNVPSGSTTLINLIGEPIALNNITMLYNGSVPTVAQSQLIIWNFPTTSSLTLNTTLYGSLLAPFTTTTATPSSVLYGTIFTDNLIGSLVSKNAPFVGVLPEFGSPSFSNSCTYSTTTTTTTTTTTSTTTTTTTTSSSTSTTTTSTTTPMPPQPCEQEINDLIESISLEQAALANILNAEGAKIQKAIAMTLSKKELLEINKSVRDIIDVITTLEMILSTKLNNTSNTPKR